LVRHIRSVCALLVQSPSTLPFFVHDTATTYSYTLSLHDALPISRLHAALRKLSEAELSGALKLLFISVVLLPALPDQGYGPWQGSEEHTSELQSRENLVCRLLLEKKNGSNTLNTSRSIDTRLSCV